MARRTPRPTPPESSDENAAPSALGLCACLICCVPAGCWGRAVACATEPWFDVPVAGVGDVPGAEDDGDCVWAWAWAVCCCCCWCWCCCCSCRAGRGPDAVGICSTYCEMGGGVANAAGEHTAAAEQARTTRPPAKDARETCRNTRRYCNNRCRANWLRGSLRWRGPRPLPQWWSPSPRRRAATGSPAGRS